MRKKQWLVVACILMAVFSGPLLARISTLSVVKKTDWYSFLQVNENEAPVADFNFSSAGDCSDQVVNSTSTSTGEGLSYLWDFGDPNSGNNNTSTQRNPSHVFVGSPGNGSQEFTVTLTVTDKDEGVNSTVKKVTRKQIPSLVVGSDKDDNTFDNLPFFIVCENNGVNFTFYNNSTTKATNVKYEIDWGDGSPKFVGSDWE